MVKCEHPPSDTKEPAMFKLTFVILSTVFAVSSSESSCSFSKFDRNIIECCKNVYDMETDEKELVRASNKCGASNASGDYCTLLKCVLSQQGLVTADKINTTSVIAATMRGKDEAAWGKVISDAVKTCQEKMVGKECPELFFLDCVDVVSFLNCPKTEWTENETCGQMKKTLSNCTY